MPSIVRFWSILTVSMLATIPGPQPTFAQVPSPVPDLIAPSCAVPPQPFVEPAKKDDLTKINGIDSALAKRLNEIGVFAFEQIANWSPDDVVGRSYQLGFKYRVDSENWLGQARILSAGKVTPFCKRWRSKPHRPGCADPLSEIQPT